MKKLCQGNKVIEILADRRKKILVDNTCIKNDGFILVNSWINWSDWIVVVNNSENTLWTCFELLPWKNIYLVHEILTICLAECKLRELQVEWSWIWKGCKPIRKTDIYSCRAKHYEHKIHAWEFYFLYINKFEKLKTLIIC